MIQALLVAASLAIPTFPFPPNPCVVDHIAMDGRIQYCIYAPESGKLIWVNAWTEIFEMECYARGYACFPREVMDAILGIPKRKPESEK